MVLELFFDKQFFGEFNELDLISYVCDLIIDFLQLLEKNYDVRTELVRHDFLFVFKSK